MPAKKIELTKQEARTISAMLDRYKRELEAVIESHTCDGKTVDDKHDQAIEREARYWLALAEEYRGRLEGRLRA